MKQKLENCESKCFEITYKKHGGMILSTFKVKKQYVFFHADYIEIYNGYIEKEIHNELIVSINEVPLQILNFTA